MRKGNCRSMASSTGLRAASLICAVALTTSHCVTSSTGPTVRFPGDQRGEYEPHLQRRILRQRHVHLRQHGLRREPAREWKRADQCWGVRTVEILPRKSAHNKLTRNMWDSRLGCPAGLNGTTARSVVSFLLGG